MSHKFTFLTFITVFGYLCVEPAPPILWRACPRMRLIRLRVKVRLQTAVNCLSLTIATLTFLFSLARSLSRSEFSDFSLPSHEFSSLFTLGFSLSRSAQVRKCCLHVEPNESEEFHLYELRTTCYFILVSNRRPLRSYLLLRRIACWSRVSFLLSPMWSSTKMLRFVELLTCRLEDKQSCGSLTS